MNTQLPLALVTAALFSAPALAQTVYVDANLTTGLGDGSSWANALQGPLGLQSALISTPPGRDIFVADGRYTTSTTTGLVQRSRTFRLQSGVRVYGGFQGGESGLADRPPMGSAPSVLSGDILGNDDGTAASMADNSFSVVDASTFTDKTALLDGFVVTGGFAFGPFPSTQAGAGMYFNGDATIRNCIVRGNYAQEAGGAVLIGRDPCFFNCRFEQNEGGNFGGAVRILAGRPLFDGCVFTDNRAQHGGAMATAPLVQPTVRNCLFTGNEATATDGGGALWFDGSGAAILQNSTIVGNTAPAADEGGILVLGAVPTIANCILWGNSGAGGAMDSANQVSSNAALRYCLVMGGFAGGIGNIQGDPLFLDRPAGDYRLGPGSPAVDAGDSNALDPTVMVDLAGQGRYRDEPMTPNTGSGGGAIDIGAYELQVGTVGSMGAVYCIGAPNSVGGIGRLFAFGSSAVSGNDVTLVGSGLPPHQMSVLVTSQTQDFVPNAGGSTGDLCLGGMIGRFKAPSQVMTTDAGGTMTIPIDLTALPTPMGATGVLAGQSWNFQAWHRDGFPGFPSSNFTSAIEITFE